MSDRTTVALVGIGGYGDSYLAALLNNLGRDHYDVVGVADCAPQQSKRLSQLRECRIPVYNDAADLLNEQAPDLVLLSTPIHLHAPQTLMALAAGSSVLCEKPAAATPRDVQRVCEAQERAGRQQPTLFG